MVGINFGKRIKYDVVDNLLYSHKVYSDEHTYVRIVIDTQAMTYKLVDPLSGLIHVQGGEGITNLEVLQRHAKKALKKLLGASFEKEKRKKEVVTNE